METETSSSAPSVAVASVMCLVPVSAPRHSRSAWGTHSYPVTIPWGHRVHGSHPLLDFSPDLGFLQGVGVC